MVDFSSTFYSSYALLLYNNSSSTLQNEVFLRLTREIMKKNEFSVSSRNSQLEAR